MADEQNIHIGGEVAGPFVVGDQNVVVTGHRHGDLTVTGSPGRSGPGRVLAGRYRLLERIGRGGMGEVWRGTDEVLRRAVAVKLIHPDRAADPAAAARFHREARAAAALDHPGIVVLYDLGEHDGRLFLVMELLEGTDLGSAVAAAPHGLPLGRVLSVLLQVSDALGAAHAKGVVHRDLKPANLVTMPDGAVKVCDFGIARFAEATTLTAEGQWLGTAAYMAPEQWRGAGVDARADLYALGCVLHELLTGRPPFGRGADPRSLMYHHLHTAPAGPRAVRPGLPEAVDRLTLDLLAKDPGDRPADAGVLAARLRAAGSVPPPAPARNVTLEDARADTRANTREDTGGDTAEGGSGG